MKRFLALALLFGCSKPIETTVPVDDPPEEIGSWEYSAEQSNLNSDLLGTTFKTPGMVDRIIDGDTIEIAGEPKIKLRIAYIDCPDRGEKWFDESVHFATEKLLNQSISYVDMGPDKARRTLAIVYVDTHEGQVDYGKSIVRAGFAKCYPKSKKYRDEQKNAQADRLGVWSKD